MEKVVAKVAPAKKEAKSETKDATVEKPAVPAETAAVDSVKSEVEEKPAEAEPAHVEEVVVKEIEEVIPETVVEEPVAKEQATVEEEGAAPVEEEKVEPEPVKETIAPSSTGEGEMDSIVPVGGVLTCTNRIEESQSDHPPSLSCTRKEIVWVPALRPVPSKSSSLPRLPSREEFHSYPVMVPSSSVPEPRKETGIPSLAGKGPMESIIATGSVLG